MTTFLFCSIFRQMLDIFLTKKITNLIKINLKRFRKLGIRRWCFHFSPFFICIACRESQHLHLVKFYLDVYCGTTWFPSVTSDIKNIEEKKNHHLYLPWEEFTGINWAHVALQSCLSEILKERILKTWFNFVFLKSSNYGLKFLQVATFLQ